MDISRASGSAGTVWSHLVYVVVPTELNYRNVSNAFLSSGDNSRPNAVDGPDALDVTTADTFATYSKTISIVIKHIPNAPIVFPSDPEKMERSEDSLLAWAWHQFMIDPNFDVEWLPHLPMVKASYQCMRAAQEAL